jgi:SAGA-associated factor 29
MADQKRPKKQDFLPEVTDINIIMSQRARSGRNSNRNNGGGGEESQLWEMIKSQLNDIVTGVNTDNENLASLLSMDKKAAIAAKDGGGPTGSDLGKMEQLCRTGVKLSEANSATIRSTIEQLNVLKALQQANHKEANESLSGPSASGSRTGGTSRHRDVSNTASLYDFDGAGDSPVPSPAAPSRKHGDRSSNRDSIPPKADSVEPQGSTGSGGPGSSQGAAGSSAASAAAAAAALARGGKPNFNKGDKVAFKRKKEEPTAGEAPYDWILGEVVGVMGEGKSRRYKCLDVEPEEPSKAKEFKTFASNMIPIPSEKDAAALPKVEAGKMVLALYPQTTAFYAADVVNTEAGGMTVNLKFHGENDSSTTHQVERRFVLEFRA